MRRPLRIGLIGAGGIGAYHLRSIEALEQSGRAQLAAVADPTRDRLPETRDALQAREVPWHLDYRKLLADEELDAVTIATPIPFHYQMTLDALARGLWVNLEKPPVPLIQQLRDLIAADPHRRVAVGFQYILSACVQRLKESIAAGRLGEIESVRAVGCWPRRDAYYARASWAGKMKALGGPVFDGPATNALAHLIHNMVYLASPDRDGFATATEVTGELYRARPIESYDVACGRGRFASGATFAFAFTHATPEALPFKILVRGSKGEALISQDGFRLEGDCGELASEEPTQILLDKCYEELLALTAGQRPRASTHLRDALGYVSITNGLLVSSGGIQQLEDKWLSTYEGEGGLGYDVAQVRPAVEDVMESGRLFSEQGVPWAKAGKLISLDSLTTLDFDSFCQTSEPPR